ncbi:HAD-IA family hydrolase [Streptomyces sp. NBC_00237]|uniref:HAD-IA family hydrolase n=1 Tax=Streptomyces sp. NBC_00237 TaxID=2975687 RepID=UPI00224DC8C5|nr:HAD-IA family hydrolase [Streptomyces sp. NBC_00237]MCX5205802.1 HAD-IA family hydrolase [Streptomyces sp. NBC_00237]
MTITAVLFDVDGVLLDSTTAHRRVWDEWSRLRGLSAEKVWQLTFGRRPEDTVRDAAPHLNAAAERRVLDQLLSREEDHFPAVEGAAPLLRSLPAGKWAIVTSGDRESVHRRFAAADLPLPDVQVFATDVEQGKPAPDCFLLAASRLAVDPSQCLVVEDAPVGARAGKAAGCTVVGLTTTHPANAISAADFCVPTLQQVGALLIAHGMITDVSEGMMPFSG